MFSTGASLGAFSFAADADPAKAARATISAAASAATITAVASIVGLVLVTVYLPLPGCLFSMLRKRCTPSDRWGQIGRKLHPASLLARRAGVPSMAAPSHQGRHVC